MIINREKRKELINEVFRKREEKGNLFDEFRDNINFFISDDYYKFGGIDFDSDDVIDFLKDSAWKTGSVYDIDICIAVHPSTTSFSDDLVDFVFICGSTGVSIFRYRGIDGLLKLKK